jgi:hypothetical protein
MEVKNLFYETDKIRPVPKSGKIIFASGGQGLFLKKLPLDPAKTFV